MTGKTTIARHLASKLGFTLVDYEKLTETLKAKLGGDDGPLEELPFEKFSDHLAQNIKNSKNTILLEGWPYSF